MSRAHSSIKALLLMALAAGILSGQETPVAAPTPRPGFQIASLSGYAVYYSTGMPEGYYQPTATPLPSDVGLGGSAQFQWTHTSERSQAFFSYTPAYTGRLRLSSWNALNHSMSANGSRRFGKWNFGFSMGASLDNFAEILFAPTTYSTVAAAPVAFSDLASAMLTGQYTNAQLASILTGAPLVESPARNIFYGARMFNASAQSTISYALSQRLSITLTGAGNRSQQASGNPAGSSQNTYAFIPTTTSVGTTLSVSYAESPRTQLGISVGSDRVVSLLEDAYAARAGVSFGRRMGTRWFLQLSGGAGRMIPVRSAFVLDKAMQPTMAASLGFHTFSHTLLGSYSRDVSDFYGLGALSTYSATGTWRWRRPGRMWWTESLLSWQELSGNPTTNTTAWRVEAGLGRALTNRTGLLTQYVYLHYALPLLNAAASSQSAVRVSFVWNPQYTAFQ